MYCSYASTVMSTFFFDEITSFLIYIHRYIHIPVESFTKYISQSMHLNIGQY